MTNRRVAFLFAVCELLFVPLMRAQSGPEKTKGFHPPPFHDMYFPDKSQPIAEMGLNAGELTDVFSTVQRASSHGAGAGLRSSAALKKELGARYVDMGSGAENGLVVNGRSELCGSGGCATWFFRKSQAKWRLVLDGQGPGAFAFIPPKHKGLFDLVLVGHLSADDAPTEVWQFSGTRYQLAKSYCFHSQSGRTEEGKCP